MKEIGLFVFPWDLADEGIDRVMGFAAESGITTLYMASVYHAGLFLQPHNPLHKVYMLEDGVAYFHPRMEGYAAIRPTVARVSRETDWFNAAAIRAPKFGVRLAAWTVCMHNSRLGDAHPEAVVQDAFGNPRSYALCPSHPEVQHYIRSILKDLARYPISAMLLEAFRYMDVVHGAHHERWSIPLPPLERTLLALSFAPTDLVVAAQAGIDGDRVRNGVSRHLEHFFTSYPAIPPDFPRTVEEFDQRFPALAAYRRCLASVLDGLLDSVVADLSGRHIELISQGQQEFNITCSPTKAGFDALFCSVYDQKPVEAGNIVRRAKRRATPGQKVYAGVKLGFGAIEEHTQLADILIELDDAGADAALFYNYAECASAILDWIAPSIKTALVKR